MIKKVDGTYRNLRHQLKTIDLLTKYCGTMIALVVTVYIYIYIYNVFKREFLVELVQNYNLC